MRDSQRSKVYRWERSLLPDFFGDRMPLEKCVKLINKVCKGCGVAPPVVSAGRKVANASLWKINLPPYARTKPIVLHEVAHTITKSVYGGLAAGHGPEFVRCFMWLLQKYHKQPLRKMQQAAKEKRVKYGSAQVVKKIQAKPLVYFCQTVAWGHLPIKKLQKVKEIVEG